jgi:hypothetical protein
MQKTNTQKNSQINPHEPSLAIKTIIKKLKKFWKSKQEFLLLKTRSEFNRFFNPRIKNKQIRFQILFKILQRTWDAFDYQVSTFFAAVQIFDSYISKIFVMNEHLILVGLCCLLISAKIHEPKNSLISVQTMQTLANDFKLEQYLKMEKKILQVLGFQVNNVNVYEIVSFLIREFKSDYFNFFKDHGLNEDKIKNFYHVLSRLNFISLIDYNFYKYKALPIAVAILIVARKAIGLPSWPYEFSNFTGITYMKVMEIVKILSHLLKNDFESHIFNQFELFEEQEKWGHVMNEENKICFCYEKKN